jgi:sRNA-binding protein
MPAAEIKTRPPQSTGRRPSAPRSPWDPWIAEILADWCQRWPAVFTKPVPLATGISKRIKAILQAEGKALDRKTVGVVIYRWTMQGSYLHAMARGETRRDLDGSEAGIVDDEARQRAQKMLDERAARRAERAAKAGEAARKS